MALQHVVCAAAVVIALLCQGCHSQLDACAKAGDEDESPASWPWLATINVAEIWSCGGSLINNQWVLTLGNCMLRSLINFTDVSLGQFNESGSNPNQVKLGIADIIPYPDKYSSIALVKLSAPVNYTDYIQPICLAAADSTFHNGTSSWITGFPKAATTILQEQNVPIMGLNECNCSYSGRFPEDSICAAFPPGGLCSETGGPLVTKKDYLWIQSGIGLDFGSCYFYTPYVNVLVSKYQDWINNTVTGPKPGFVKFTSPGIDSDLNFQCPTAPPPTTASTTVSTTASTTVSTTASTTKDDGSIFGGGKSLLHFAHFGSLGVLTLLVFLGM